MGVLTQVGLLSLGGALGANARYWLGRAIANHASPRFPWSTVSINVSGSFAIGFLAIALAERYPAPWVRLLVVTGFLGGYTTFSAFALESLDLWERGDRASAAANAVGSVAAGLIAVALGAAIARATFGVSPARSEAEVASTDEIEVGRDDAPGRSP